MGKNIAIGALVLIAFLLARAVVRLENFHYASFVGMENECGPPPDVLHTFRHHKCLHDQETRTSPYWHLYYGLFYPTP